MLDNRIKKYMFGIIYPANKIHITRLNVETDSWYTMFKTAFQIKNIAILLKLISLPFDVPM